MHKKISGCFLITICFIWNYKYTLQDPCRSVLDLIAVYVSSWKFDFCGSNEKHTVVFKSEALVFSLLLKDLWVKLLKDKSSSPCISIFLLTYVVHIINMYKAVSHLLEEEQVLGKCSNSWQNQGV